MRCSSVLMKMTPRWCLPFSHSRSTAPELRPVFPMPCSPVPPPALGPSAPPFPGPLDPRKKTERREPRPSPRECRDSSGRPQRSRWERYHSPQYPGWFGPWGLWGWGGSGGQGGLVLVVLATLSLLPTQLRLAGVRVGVAQHHGVPTWGVSGAHPLPGRLWCWGDWTRSRGFWYWYGRAVLAWKQCRHLL